MFALGSLPTTPLKAHASLYLRFALPWSDNWGPLHPDADADALAHALNRLPYVHSITLGSEGEISPEAMAALRHASANDLSLQGISVNNNSLITVGRMPALIDLSIRSKEVTDAGLAHLKPLANLRALAVDGSPIDGSFAIYRRS